MKALFSPAKKLFGVHHCALVRGVRQMLPAVMIFLQQRKDLLDHLANESGPQTATGSSLHVVALKSDPLPSSILLLSAFILSKSSFFLSFSVIHLHESLWLLRILPQLLPPSIFVCFSSRPRLLYNVSMNRRLSRCPPAVSLQQCSGSVLFSQKTMAARGNKQTSE